MITLGQLLFAMGILVSVGLFVLAQIMDAKRILKREAEERQRMGFDTLGQYQIKAAAQYARYTMPDDNEGATDPDIGRAE